MKKALAALLALMMILTLSACGGKSDDVTGKYLCVSAKVYGDSAEPDDRWLELKKGGKGTFFDGYEFNLEWKLDGETFTGTVSFMGMENSLEGTLKDGVLNAKYGDYDFSFAKEGVQAGSDAASSNGIVGEYSLYSAVVEGTDYTLEELQSVNMADGTYLILNADGTGEICLADDEPDSFTYDESAGELVFPDGLTCKFAVDGKMITVDVEEASMELVFAPKSDTASNGDSGNAIANHSDFFGDVTVASTMDDAFAGAHAAQASDFVSPTTSITLGNMWYGTLQVTDVVGTGQEDFEKDIIANLKKTRDGDEFFEVYTDSSMSDESIVLSMYVTVYDDYFLPVIGEDDAWIFERYLTPDDATYFMRTLENGALDITYAYEDPDGKYTCTVRIFLREDGTPWDEANDPLPPSYEEYKAALSK